MTCVKNFGCGGSAGSGNCPDKFGCPPGKCPDFTIRRHDTKPAFKVAVNDCDGPLDLTGLVLEANMWAKAKLKKAICPEDTYFGLADGIGFEQINVGDVIYVERVRRPEQMLVTGFDEDNGYVLVQRGWSGTTAGHHKKGTTIRIFRMLNSPAQTEMILQDIDNIDGTVTQDQLTDSYLVYEWQPNDTCLPGCFWLEFKLLKLVDNTGISIISTTPDEGVTHDVVTLDGDILNPTPISEIPTVIPFESISCVEPSTVSFTDVSVPLSTVNACGLGANVEWVRRFPVDCEGFLIKIIDTPTRDIL